MGRQSTHFLTIGNEYLATASVHESRRYSLHTYTYLKSRGAPIHKLHDFLGFQGRDGCIDVFRDDISPVQKTYGHILSLLWIAFHHLTSRIKARLGELVDSEAIVCRRPGRNYRSVCGQRIMDPRIWHEVHLELVEIHVQGTVESQ